MEKLRYFFILLEIVIITEALPYPERNKIRVDDFVETEGNETKIQYSEARQDETIVNNYHDFKIKDPYRWHEHPDSKENNAFVNTQNGLVTLFLSAGSVRKEIDDSDFPVYSCPRRHGDKYYFNKINGLQDQNIYVQDTLDSEPRVFLNLSSFSEVTMNGISYQAFSGDGKIMAFSLMNNGSDSMTIYFINTETGKRYPEVLKNIKYFTITWMEDSEAILYTLHRTVPKEGVNGDETQGLENGTLFYHIVGTPQSEDVRVMKFSEELSWIIETRMTGYEKQLLISVTENGWSNLVFATKFSPNGTVIENVGLTKIVGNFGEFYAYVTNDGPHAIFHTDKNAPNYRLIRINLEDPAEDKWTVLLPEHPQKVLESVYAVDGDKFVAQYTRDTKTILQLHSLKTGKRLKTFFLDIGTVEEFSGDKKNSQIFFKFTSFLTPGLIYTMDLANDEEPKIYREIKIHNFDPRAFRSMQVFHPSNDGKQIPMSIITKANAVLNEPIPALSPGHSDFRVSVKPDFNVMALDFINAVFAVANIQGKGEYEKQWHDVRRFLNMQNVFNDIRRAAEYLIENKTTTPSKLTTQLGYNGGLFAAAYINQQPDLFGAAAIAELAMNMLRYHKFTTGYAWVSEYGTSNDPEQSENSFKYSPLRNVKAPLNGVKFLANHDDHRVGGSPDQSHPIVNKIETDVSHGSGKPMTNVVCSIKLRSKAPIIFCSIMSLIHFNFVMKFFFLSILVTKTSKYFTN